jgi:hypothetical protein
MSPVAIIIVDYTYQQPHLFYINVLVKIYVCECEVYMASLIVLQVDLKVIEQYIYRTVFLQY